MTSIVEFEGAKVNPGANGCIKVDGTKGHTKRDVVVCAKGYIKGHLKRKANYTLHFQIIIFIIYSSYFCLNSMLLTRVVCTNDSSVRLITYSRVRNKGVWLFFLKNFEEK